jgi:hypothetical protein
LAGDAAHIHSPVGGQGMNTGIQDAYNLCWKLDRILDNKSGKNLLMSYQEERRPIAQDVIRNTDLLTRLATLRRPFLTWLRNKGMETFSSVSFVLRRITRTISELGVNYRDSSIVERLNSTGWFGSGLRPGDRVPNLKLFSNRTNPECLFEILETTNYVLLLFSDEKSEDYLNTIDEQIVEKVDLYQVLPDKNGFSGQEVIHDPERKLRELFGLKKDGLVVIRPDDYVGLISDEVNVEQLQRYLER